LRNGALASMTFSAVSGAPDEPSSMTIHGENGALRLTGAEALLARRGSQQYERIAGGPMEPRPGNSMGGAFGSGTVELGRALKRAIDDGDRAALAPAATFADGLAQQRVLDAARRAAAGGGGMGV
jgi:predicted dehydrogenase